MKNTNKKTVIGKLASAERGKCSCYGNPSYRDIWIKGENNEAYHFDKTAPNSSAGYNLSNAGEFGTYWRFYYHTTRCNQIILDYVEALEGGERYRIARENFVRLTEANSHIEAAIELAELCRAYIENSVLLELLRLSRSPFFRFVDITPAICEIQHALRPSVLEWQAKYAATYGEIF